MTRPALAVLVLAMVSGCKSREPPAEAPLRWIELTPMPVKLEAPKLATAALTQESLDRTAPPGMIISARECVLVVTPGSRGDLATQEAAIVAEHAGATFTKKDSPAADGSGLYLAFQYAGQSGAPLRSFRFETTIGETTYRCEPFTGRAEVGCEEAACRSLRAR